MNAVLFAATDSVLVTGGYDRSVRCWDGRSASIDAIQSMAPFRDSVSSLALDGAAILAGSVDGSVRCFDLRAGRCVTDDLHAPVTCVRVTRDGACVLAAQLGGRLALLDRASGRLLAEYRGHRNEAAKLECGLSLSDAFVASGSEDGRLVFWEVVDGAVAAEVQAHGPGKALCGLAFHPSDEAALLTCATDGLVKLWAPQEA